MLQDKSIDQLGDSVARHYNGLWLGLRHDAYVQVTTMRYAVFCAASRIASRTYWNEAAIETARLVWQHDTTELDWLWNMMCMFNERCNMCSPSSKVTLSELLQWCDDVQCDWQHDIPNYRAYVETLLVEFRGYCMIPSKDSSDDDV